MKSTTLLLEQIIQDKSFSISTFKLKSSRIEIRTNRLIYGLGVFLIPLLFANVVYTFVLKFNNTELILATGITGLIFLNLAIYLENRTTKGNRTLIVGHHSIKILKNSKVLHVIPFENLTVTLLNLGNEKGDQQPAIRISGQGFPCMTIGNKTNNWKNSKDTIGCTAFIIESEKEWNKLINTLSFFEKS